MSLAASAFRRNFAAQPADRVGERHRTGAYRLTENGSLPCGPSSADARSRESSADDAAGAEDRAAHEREWIPPLTWV